MSERICRALLLSNSNANEVARRFQEDIPGTDGFSVEQVSLDEPEPPYFLVIKNECPTGVCLEAKFFPTIRDVGVRGTLSIFNRCENCPNASTPAPISS
jgi:hypothetical protein